MSTQATADISNSDARPKGLRTDTLATSVVFLMALTCVLPVVAFVRDFLFAAWLTPNQLGRWGVAFSYITLASPLVLFGIPGSFGRYLDFYRERGQLRTFLRRTGLTCAMLSAVAIGAILYSTEWCSTLVFNSPVHTRLVVQMSFCLVGMIIYGYVVESLTAIRLFRIVSALHFVKGILFAALGLAMLVYWELSASSIILAHGLACLIASAIAMRWLLPACWAETPTEVAPLPHRDLWRKLLPFALSIWVVNALANLFSLIDRYMIVHYGQMTSAEALTQVGYYQSSRMIPLLFISFAGMLGSLTLPHLTHDWEKGRREEVSRTLHLAIKVFGLALLAGGTALLVVAPLLYHVGLEGKYDGGLAVLPWTCIYCAWFSLGLLVELYLQCSEKTYLCVCAFLAGLVVNVALNLVLLPILGLQGAVLATAGATLVMLTIAFALSHRFGLAIDVRTWAVVLLMPALALGTWGALAVTVVVAFVVIETNWLLSEDERRRVWDVACGYAGKLSARMGRG